jgi:hypothetical protein
VGTSHSLVGVEQVAVEGIQSVQCSDHLYVSISVILVALIKWCTRSTRRIITVGGVSHIDTSPHSTMKIEQILDLLVAETRGCIRNNSRSYGRQPKRDE